MTDDSESARDLLVDAFGRIHEAVHETLDGIDERHLVFRPDPDANTISWLIWHLTRIQDDHIAGIAGVPQAWTDQGWADRLALPFDRHDVGYGQTTEQVGMVTIGASDLRGYHDAAHALTMSYLGSVDAAELARVVDTSWDPPVTASVRIVSVIGDCLQHLGQAAYVRGIAERQRR
jgi:hypothetical protein